MAASTIPAAVNGGSDNWVSISSVTPTAASSAVNFTGISGYKKLMVVINAVTLASSSNITLRLNNDSGSNYVTTSSSAQGTFSTGQLLNTNATTTTSVTEITSTDTTNLKILSGTNATNAVGAYQYSIRGIYVAAASITQVNLVCSATYAGAGTITLYGVAS